MSGQQGCSYKGNPSVPNNNESIVGSAAGSTGKLCMDMVHQGQMDMH